LESTSQPVISEWSPAWITGGGNRRFNIAIDLFAFNFTHARETAGWLLQDVVISKWYIKDAKKLYTRDYEPIRLKTESAPGRVLYDWRVQGSFTVMSLADSSFHVVEQIIKESIQNASPTIRNWEISHDERFWKKWNVIATITASTKERAMQILFDTFQPSAARMSPAVIDANQVTMLGPYQPLFSKETKMETYKLYVDVECHASRAFVEQRAAHLLNNCSAVLEWEILELTSYLPKAEISLLIDYQAFSYEGAVKEIEAALAKESPDVVISWDIHPFTEKSYGDGGYDMRVRLLSMQDMFAVAQKLGIEFEGLGDVTRRKILTWIITDKLGSGAQIQVAKQAIAAETPCAADWVYKLKNGMRITIISNNSKRGVHALNEWNKTECSMSWPSEGSFFAFVADIGVQDIFEEDR
jgi:hypothetical protein